jgi:hypothetical protein
VTERDPLLLDEALEPVDGAEVRIHNQLGQGRDHGAQISTLRLCNLKK